MNELQVFIPNVPTPFIIFARHSSILPLPWHSSAMDYIELVTSLEYEALEHKDSRAGDMLAQAAEAITALHNRSSDLQSDIEDLLQELSIFKAARLRLAK
jgi:hypothetical protein